jgi:protein-disulfide isomerase
MEPQQPKKSQLTVPMSIIAAGCIIALGIFLSGDKSPLPSQQETPSADLQTTSITIRPVAADDHILGNPNAKVVFVEYSDMECPFCKTYHPTLTRILDEYGKSGDFAWVYRQFPITELHPKARKESEAVLCAGNLGGNDAFWGYTKKIFAITPSNNGLDPKLLITTAGQQGLNEKAFQTCLDSGKMAEAVEKDYQDGLKAGVRGTPHTIAVLQKPLTEKTKKTLSPLFEKYRDRYGQLPIFFGEDGRSVGISGGMPYDVLKKTLDILIATQ